MVKRQQPFSQRLIICHRHIWYFNINYLQRKNKDRPARTPKTPNVVFVVASHYVWTPGGTPKKIGRGVRPLPKTLTLFMTKIYDFP